MSRPRDEAQGAEFRSWKCLELPVTGGAAGGVFFLAPLRSGVSKGLAWANGKLIKPGGMEDLMCLCSLLGTSYSGGPPGEEQAWLKEPLPLQPSPRMDTGGQPADKPAWSLPPRPVKVATCRLGRERREKNG